MMGGCQSPGKLYLDPRVSRTSHLDQTASQTSTRPIVQNNIYLSKHVQVGFSRMCSLV